MTKNMNSCLSLENFSSIIPTDPYRNLNIDNLEADESSFWQPLRSNQLRIIPHSNHNSKRQNLILKSSNFATTGTCESPLAASQFLLPRGVKSKPTTKPQTALLSYRTARTKPSNAE